MHSLLTTLSRRRRLAALIAACALSAALPATALADNTTAVGRDSGNNDPYDANNGELVYFGAYGGANNAAGSADTLTVSQSNGSLVFTDWYHDITAGTTCHNLSDHQVSCSGASLDELRIHLFEGGNMLNVSDGITTTVRVDSGQHSDTISGGGGTTHVESGAGVDYVSGGPGTNFLYGGAGNDTLKGYGGNDLLYGEGDNDTLTGGDGPDSMMGGTGYDTATYQGASSGVYVNLRNDVADGRPGENDHIATDNVTGTPYKDTLVGDAGGNKLTGNGGPDYLKGKWGNDNLIGNAGQDRLDGDRGNDNLDGGTSADIINCGLGVDTHVFDPSDLLAATSGCE